MDKNMLVYILPCIFSPFISFFLLKIINFRAERVVSEFYCALQEKTSKLCKTK